jgi:hypothetical protein
VYLIMTEPIQKRLIQSLVQRGCDYTLLFWLSKPEMIEHTELGRQMRDFLREFQLTLSDFNDSTVEKIRLKQDLMKAVRAYFGEHKIQPIRPRNFLVHKNKGSKVLLLEKYKAVDWPKPRQCYVVQASGGGNVLFFVYQTWQDAVICQYEMLQMGSYCGTPVSLVYEHQWIGIVSVVRLIIDWEIKASAYEGRLSLEEIKGIPDQFPQWLVSEMRRVGALGCDQKVICYVKDKTRQVSTDVKISKHFIFNIGSVTMGGGHFEVLTDIIRPYVTRLQAFHKDKTLKCIESVDDLRHPVWGWDNSLLRGQNGISTMFGSKPGERNAPLPRLPCKLIMGSSCEVRETSWKGLDVSLESLTREQCLEMLYMGSYTTPWPGMVGYNHSYIMSKQQVCLFMF